jgi:hypothetical protein
MLYKNYCQGLCIQEHTGSYLKKYFHVHLLNLHDMLCTGSRLAVLSTVRCTGKQKY